MVLEYQNWQKELGNVEDFKNIGLYQDGSLGILKINQDQNKTNRIK